MSLADAEGTARYLYECAVHRFSEKEPIPEACSNSFHLRNIAGCAVVAR